jgi:hypothetical protein
MAAASASPPSSLKGDARYRYKKRAPVRPLARKTDIYVTRRRSLAALRTRAMQLLFHEK